MSTDLQRRTEMPSQDAPAVAALDRLSNEQIRYIANTDVVPKHLRGKPDAMLAVILKGRALGFDDIHSLTAINFIDGRATLAAEAMVALVRSKGHSIEWTLTPGESCTASGIRRDSGDEGTVTWTMAMAKDAGLAGSKDNWRRHPDTMLTWRAISQLCRFLFPDVLMGVSYTPDEAEEAAERGAVSEAVANLPGLEEQHVRVEAQTVPSEAQLNRIASLEQRVDGYQAVLRGVFGVEMAMELSPDAAVQYEAALTMAATPIEEIEGEVEDSAEGPEDAIDTASQKGPDGGSSPVVAGEKSQDPPSAENDSDAALADPPAAGAASEELPGEPEPISDERLVELAAETLIPIGQYRGKKLGEIHDGWLEYALRNTSKLTPAFIEALELFVRERKPEMWERERSEPRI